MNCWETLGVEPYSDLRALKRAYARLLKEVHPEEHPEQFMALREAYETAQGLTARAAQANVHSRSPVIEDRDASEQPVVPLEPDARQQAKIDQERLAIAENEAFARRMQALADAFQELLQDAQRRNELGNWQALLGTPELSNLDIRLRHGALLLPALIQLLSDKQQQPLPAKVLVLLDDSFHWTQDQCVTLPVSEESMQRLCLLLAAAHSSIASAPPRTGWKWFFKAMLDTGGRLSRTEFFVGLALTVAIVWLIGLAGFWVLPRDGFALLGSGLTLMSAYVLVNAYCKRIADSGRNVVLMLIIGIFVPFVYLFYAFVSPKKDLTSGDPRTAFVDPLVIAVNTLFRGGFRHGGLQRSRRFAMSMTPPLAWGMLAIFGTAALTVLFV
ncbi:J domain-containing protein [Halopseudomonas sp.]|uniref:J domain-containing protein n=1 Tax=Halopseudomonas sp. TaxID=2901191 RepID=UPI00312002A1